MSAHLLLGWGANMETIYMHIQNPPPLSNSALRPPPPRKLYTEILAPLIFIASVWPSNVCAFYFVLEGHPTAPQSCRTALHNLDISDVWRSRF